MRSREITGRVPRQRGGRTVSGKELDQPERQWRATGWESSEQGL